MRVFAQYLSELFSVFEQGDAREESFYPALKNLFEAFASHAGRQDVRVTVLPKKTDAGNPDFRVWNGTDKVVGYIEAKPPTEERLDIIEQTEQVRRYRATFPNLILTNFLEFRLYRNGDLAESALLARPFILTTLRTKPVLEQPKHVESLLARFLDFSLPRAFTAETLAVEIAKRTRFLRDVVELQLRQERGSPGILTGFYEAFQAYLIGTLTPSDFADLFAQTIAYGLFAARTRFANGFNRRAAFDGIPRTLGVLRDLFRFISLGDLPEQLAWCVDDIAHVLAVADARDILERYYREGKGSDPIVHFYETFLSQYDPEEREKRGVYYTPEPVVGYIVRSLHEILKTHFGLPDGLASEGVTLLDPAAGTMTFVAQAAQQAVAEFEAKYGTGARADFIRDHILKNFYAFELMMAPYAIGHLKMGFLFEELGYRLAEGERIQFYLTNALDIEDLQQSRLPGLIALAEESRLAGQVKKQTPILVILGNPPYSGHSANMGEWICGLVADYKKVRGQPLREKNVKWLQDDYVKFLRFAQWKIEQAGRGVVGMITNHSYLDNPTFQGMRESLMRTFDEIYLLDLHGNSLKKEKCPDGSPDENVFDIRQGVAIAFFVRRGTKGRSIALVRHAEIYGLRQAKYGWLDGHDVRSTQWREIQPAPPLYLFRPRNETLAAYYAMFPSVSEIFRVKSVGIVTARDSLTIHWTPEEVWRTVTVFANMDPELARETFGLGKDARDWKVELAQKDLLKSGPSRGNVVPILYRPFDIRFTYYTGHSRGFHCRPRPEVMRHMLSANNVALVLPRQHKGDFGALVTATAGGHKAVAAYDINYYFPLLLHAGSAAQGLLAEAQGQSFEFNINPSLVTALAQAYGEAPNPEAIFHYIYAVLHAPTYRKKYGELLKADFPRIPFTANASLFKKVAQLGQKLVALHLLTSPDLDPPLCRFEGEGDNLVTKGRKVGLRYDAQSKRVYINASQFFAPVPDEIWQYRIGGYQVCEKWLKDRQNRHLELADIRTYCRIVSALRQTITLQSEADALYGEIEEKTVSISAGTQ